MPFLTWRRASNSGEKSRADRRDSSDAQHYATCIDLVKCTRVFPRQESRTHQQCACEKRFLSNVFHATPALGRKMSVTMALRCRSTHALILFHLMTQHLVQQTKLSRTCEVWQFRENCHLENRDAFRSVRVFVCHTLTQVSDDISILYNHHVDLISHEILPDHRANIQSGF